MILLHSCHELGTIVWSHALQLLLRENLQKLHIWFPMFVIRLALNVNKFLKTIFHKEVRYISLIRKRFDHQIIFVT